MQLSSLTHVFQKSFDLLLVVSYLFDTTEMPSLCPNLHMTLVTEPAKYIRLSGVVIAI